MLFMNLSCPATTSFPAILRGKLSNSLHTKNKVVVVEPSLSQFCWKTICIIMYADEAKQANREEQKKYTCKMAAIFN